LAAGPPMEMLIRSEIIQRKEEGCDVSRAEERLSELVEGTEEEIKDVTELIESVKGEPPYPL